VRKLLIGEKDASAEIDYGSNQLHTFQKVRSTVAPGWTVYSPGFGGVCFSVMDKDVDRTDEALALQDSHSIIELPWAKIGKPTIATPATKDTAGRITFLF
jgi:hypothetical protein